MQQTQPEILKQRRSMLGLGGGAAFALGAAALMRGNVAQASTSFPSYLSVADYGALGDGVHDDTAAINSTIAAATTGSTIYFPKGTYIVKSPLLINKSLKLTGDYVIGAELLFNNNTSGIQVRPPGSSGGINTIEISNLYINGSTRATGAYGIDATATVLTNGIGYLTVDNVAIAEFDRGIELAYCQFTTLTRVHTYYNNLGVYTKRCVNTKIASCIFEANFSCGIFIDGDSTAISLSCGTLIVNTQIVGNGGTGSSSGNINIAYNENFEITGCMIDVPAPGSTYDLQITASPRGSVAQCWVGASQGSAILCNSTSECVFTANTLVSAAAYGIALASSDHCVVSANIFQQNAGTDILIYGTGSFANILTGNMCQSPLVAPTPSIQETASFGTVCCSNVYHTSILLTASSINANNLKS